MRRRVKQVAVVFVIVFAAAQLIRPERANPATERLAGVANRVALGWNFSTSPVLVPFVPLLVGRVIYAAAGRTRGNV